MVWLRLGMFQFVVNVSFYVKVSGLHEFLQPDIIENQHLIFPQPFAYTTTTWLLLKPGVAENHTLTVRSALKRLTKTTTTAKAAATLTF